MTFPSEHDKRQFAPAADVYSFGLLVQEVVLYLRHQHVHTCGQAHALLVRMWSSDPMQRPLLPEMMPTIDALLMPRGGGHGVDRVELDDGLNESDVTMML